VQAGQAGHDNAGVTVGPATARDGDGGLSLDWSPPFRVDVRLALLVHRRGSRDPTLRIDEQGAIWRTSLTPDGPATLRLTATGGSPAGRRAGQNSAGASGSGTVISASAWGEGAAWLLAAVPDLLGAADQPASFRPAHPRLADLARRFPGLRLGRTDRVLEALVPAVLEQKVVGVEARRAWRRLLTWFGSPAPGPAPTGMRVFPSVATWQAIPSWDWHRAGVEPIRARTIAAAASVAGPLERICSLPAADADIRLRSVPGVGLWTSAEVRQRACGDPDAISIGDYHIPALVGWTLTGEPTDDAGMLRLLAPCAGQRYRATRLIELGGTLPPRRGPKLGARDYRAL